MFCEIKPFMNMIAFDLNQFKNSWVHAATKQHTFRCLCEFYNNYYSIHDDDDEDGDDVALIPNRI